MLARSKAHKMEYNKKNTIHDDGTKEYNRANNNNNNKVVGCRRSVAHKQPKGFLRNKKERSGRINAVEAETETYVLVANLFQNFLGF